MIDCDFRKKTLQMRWSSSLYVVLVASVFAHRSTGIVVGAQYLSHNTDVVAFAPCSPTLNDSNLSAQFKERPKNCTDLENVSGLFSVSDTPSQGDYSASFESMNGSEASLANPPSNESYANYSASPMLSSLSSSYVSGGIVTESQVLAPAPSPSSSEHGFLAAVESGGASSQTLNRDSLSRTVKNVIVVLFGSMLVLVGLCCLDKCRASSAEVCDTRRWVKSLPVLSGDDVQKQLKSKSGYDCLHHEPQLMPGPVRLEGHVVAKPYNMLKAPLAQRSCVVFSASAAAVRWDGIAAPPAAFLAMNSEFELDLAVASGSLRVRIRGEDVALFDVASGWQHERTTWARAPEQLQDFLHAHRSGAGSNYGSMDGFEEFDFTECRLDVGAYVTCVGELRRDATGEISLWPCQDSEVAIASSVNAESTEKRACAALGLTSWESLTPSSSPRLGKVMISDDPCLLRQSRPSLCSGSCVQRMADCFRRIRQ
jgi:hypothetical protein